MTRPTDLHRKGYFGVEVNGMDQRTVRITLDDKEHVHVSYAAADSTKVREALDAASQKGYWDHDANGLSSMVWNSNRRSLVRSFRLATDALGQRGFKVVANDRSATGPSARIWEQEGLAMVVVHELGTVETMKAAAGVFQVALLDAGLATPTQLGHTEPSTEGLTGHTLAGAYEPGANLPEFVDALREHHWRVEHLSAPPI